MSEHKMTAKKVLDANTANGSRMDEARVLNAMKEFALQVATEAVEENINDWFTHKRRKEAKIHGQNIKDIIKNRLNDKNCEEG